jgi:hypothetical protein
MLFVLSGSSGAGKSTLAEGVAMRVPRLAVHELGEIAAEPWNGDRSDHWWRRDLTEQWIQRAIVGETHGTDLLITEAVLGEVLAAPSADRLSGIAACLVHCADDERVRRISARGEIDAVELQHFLNWSDWLSGHCADPQHWTGPILADGDTTWHWGRWQQWRADDPRWSVFVLDTTEEPIEDSIERLVGWIEEQRQLNAAGRLALSGRWWDR